MKVSLEYTDTITKCPPKYKLPPPKYNSQKCA